jgi:lipopolysaccharide transport system permease protein
MESAPLTIIQPSRGLVSLRLKDLWQYRELLYFMIWRDIKVRYKQTALGAAWAVLQPLLTMVVFTIFFGKLAKIPSDGIPYPIFSFCALLPWQLFARSLTESSNSLVTNQRLITKVYFPRLVIPLAAVLAGLVDFAITFLVLVGLMFYYGIFPGLALLALPVFLLLAIVTSLAASLWLSTLNVKYRDIKYTLPFLVQFWLFASPVAYSSSLVPVPWRLLYGLNPIVGVIEGFRWSLLGKTEAVWPLVITSAVLVAGLLWGGLVYFRQMEKTFADVV